MMSLWHYTLGTNWKKIDNQDEEFSEWMTSENIKDKAHWFMEIRWTNFKSS